MSRIRMSSNGNIMLGLSRGVNSTEANAASDKKMRKRRMHPWTSLVL
jgi:hypothetical protein